ncbi:hypothetical protein JCM10908_005222 [Rhodotorula pacifica]|uniref:uncharacterized protein n=1 Tax=Rhodotorula pacifica TaxID=1495444 RepID=UPI0031808E0A
MQSSLASPPLFAGLNDLYEPLDGAPEHFDHEDNSPLLLQEEMLDLMNMNPVFADDPTTMYQPVAAAEAADAPLVHLMDMDEEEYAEDAAPVDRAAAATTTMRARPSTIGRMLFPARISTSVGQVQRPKRLSAPVRSAQSFSALAVSPPSKRLSLPASGVPFLSHSTRSSAASPHTRSDAALFALPAAKQLQSEKSRLRELQSAHAEQQDAQLQATQRIQELEQALEKARLEQEGWQAEAQQLAARLEATGPSPATAAAPTTPAAVRTSDDSERISELERTLALETSKRRRGKELQSKLRCELVNRRWKEKWEVELLERVERELEIRIVQLEAKVVLDEYEREMERLERVEAEENLAVQTRQVANLSASRQLLLTSFRTSEQTVSTLRSELSTLRSESDVSATTAAERIDELEAQVEELDEVKHELASSKKELVRLEKGEKKGEAEKSKELEKERAKREKLEKEVKALKAQLKTTESALKEAEKIKASTDLGRSSSTIKATPHQTSDVEPEADEEIDAAVDDPVATTNTPDDDVASEVDEPEPEPEEPEEPEEEEVYKPTKSKSRSVPAPKPTKAVKEPKKAKVAAAKVVAEPEAEEPAEQEASEASEAESAPPTPKKAADPPKKRKADVLGDKSTNARTSQRDEAGGTVGLKVKKAKKAADGSKISALALTFGGDSDDDEDASGKAGKSKKSKKKRAGGADESDDDEDRQPKKQTKKRALLGPKKKFDWTAENADINSMIPVDLSPIKEQPAKKTNGLFSSFLSGPPTKASFF